MPVRASTLLAWRWRRREVGSLRLHRTKAGNGSGVCCLVLHARGRKLERRGPGEIRRAKMSVRSGLFFLVGVGVGFESGLLLRILKPFGNAGFGFLDLLG